MQRQELDQLQQTQRPILIYPSGRFSISGTRMDYELLSPGRWLNDTIMKFYGLRLRDRLDKTLRNRVALSCIHKFANNVGRSTSSTCQRFCYPCAGRSTSNGKPSWNKPGQIQPYIHSRVQKNCFPGAEVIDNVRKFLCWDYQSRYKVEVDFSEHLLSTTMVGIPQQCNLSDCGILTLENIYRYLCRGDKPWDAADLPRNWCTSQDAKFSRIRLAHNISALTKTNGYRGEISILKDHLANLATMGAGKEVRQKTARAVECRSMTLLTRDDEPAQKRKVLDTTTHGVTKEVTLYGTLMPPTSGTACKTPDDESVRLGFLIPLDSDKSDEITEEHSPTVWGKLLPLRHNDPGWQALQKDNNVYQQLVAKFFSRGKCGRSSVSRDSVWYRLKTTKTEIVYHPPNPVHKR
uniref:Ubiquitin-like protease family profile domain-containing protein n=1 Tax=Glossina palpalis gambiensis TaxID=67801 RepID=A0A1B0BEM0_9MUSC